MNILLLLASCFALGAVSSTILLTHLIIEPLKEQRARLLSMLTQSISISTRAFGFSDEKQLSPLQLKDL